MNAKPIDEGGTSYRDPVPTTALHRRPPPIDAPIVAPISNFSRSGLALIAVIRHGFPPDLDSAAINGLYRKVEGHPVRWGVDEGPIFPLIPNWTFFVFDWKCYAPMIFNLGDVGVKILLQEYSCCDQAGEVARSKT